MWEEESVNKLTTARCRGKDITAPVFTLLESVLFGVQTFNRKEFLCFPKCCRFLLKSLFFR